VELRVKVRRFRCDAVLCGRPLFAERFGDGALASLARRNGRLDAFFIISGWLWAGVPPPPSPRVLWCRSAMIHCCASLAPAYAGSSCH
jgi:hypothetical protein